MHPLIIRDVRNLPARRRIEALEASLVQEIEEGRIARSHHDGATDEGTAEADHLFAEGAYVRGLWIPAGCLVVGRVHLRSRVCIVAAGECAWIDEHQPDPLTVAAPWAAEFPAGSKTAVLALQDTYWLAVTGTTLRDPQEILHTLSVGNTDQYVRHLERQEVLP
jgi:hypothetical protein